MRSTTDPMPCSNRQKVVTLPLRLLDFLNERRHDVEQISDDCIIRNLEDRRLGIFVNRDDAPGTLHTNNMLDGPRDSERQIQLRSDRLSRRSDLPVHAQPSVVADRTRRRELTAQRIRQLLRPLDIFLLLDPAPHRNNNLPRPPTHPSLRFLQHFLPLLTPHSLRTFTSPP